MAVDVDRPGMGTTRRTFLAAVGCAALAALLGRRWFPTGEDASTAGAARPRRADNLLEHAGGSGVELRPTPVDPNGPVFRLNRSAALVWRGVDGRHTVGELAGLLCAAYGIPSAAAHADALECLDALGAQGLVFGVPAPGDRTAPGRT